jgi:hypothetical protein
MVYCIFHGNLNASLYFEISMSEKRDHIIDYFKKSENEIQLSPVNRKNLMGLGALKFT